VEPNVDNENEAAQKRKRRRRLSADAVVRIRKLLDSGEHTVAEVAELVQLPYFTVYSLRRGYNYREAGGPVTSDRQRALVTPERAAKIRAVRAKGASIERIAQATGLSETTIKRVLRAAPEESE
jgi:DNA-binding NarL/FixJ family response regulator